MCVFESNLRDPRILTNGQRYPNDDWRVKLLAVAVWVFDTTHQAMITHSCYVYLVTNFGDPAFLGSIVKTLLVRLTFITDLSGRELTNGRCGSTWCSSAALSVYSSSLSLWCAFGSVCSLFNYETLLNWLITKWATRISQQRLLSCYLWLANSLLFWVRCL